MMKFNYDVMIDRSVGDFPEQQRPPGPDPEMSGGLPGVQESPVCKVSPTLYPLLHLSIQTCTGCAFLGATLRLQFLTFTCISCIF